MDTRNLDIKASTFGIERDIPHFVPGFDLSTSHDSSSLLITDSQNFAPFLQSNQSIDSSKWETLQEWWVGHILEIYLEEKYFTAYLRDTDFVESIAEFDFDTVFDNDEDRSRYLFEGSEFAFFILTRHGNGSPETVSRVEFSSPYIWQEDDDKKSEELYNQLFPGDEI